MDINWTEVAAILHEGSLLLESPGIAALASLGGPAAIGAVNLAAGLADASSAAVTQAQAVAPAIASNDLATILAADAKIQASNVVINGRIAAS